MLKNKIRNSSLVISLLLLSGCSSRPVQNAFTEFGTAITQLLSNTSVVLGLMFIAMLIGTFAMFKGLLKFSFSKGFSDSTFGPKEINVIALMLSVIGSTGLFYIFRNDESVMITLFGGFVGLFLVLFLIFFLMGSVIHFANSFKDENSALGKGPAWIFLFILGSILSSYLLLGYIGQVLKSLGCNMSSSTVTCNVTNSFNLFLVFYNLIIDVLSFLLPFALLFGLLWLLKKNKEQKEKSEPSDGSTAVSESDGSSSDSSDGGWLGKVFGGSSKDNKKLSKEVKENVKNMQGNVKEFDKGLNEIKKSINEQKKILNEIAKELGRNN